MAKLFNTQFVTNIPIKKDSSDLQKLYQHDDEPLRDYVKRFNREAVQIKNLDHTLAIKSFTSGMTSRTLYNDVNLSLPQ